MNSSSLPIRLAVIGGGISGLAAAHRLTELAPAADVTLYEQAEQLGGILRTVERDGFLVERSADMFTLRDPWAMELCQRIGFQDQLISTNEQHRRAFVVRDGRLHPVPRGWSLLSPTSIRALMGSRLLSLPGRLRVAWDYFKPAGGSGQDESLASFARRRLGREAYERIVQPLVGGIFTADPEKLSMAAALPQFLAMEQSAGSLIRGGKRAARTQGHGAAGGARYGQFMAPRKGLSSLVDAIAAQLPAGSVRCQQRVNQLRHNPDGGWQLELSSPAGDTQEVTVDGIILATPASHAADLVQTIAPSLAKQLGEITSASAAVISLGYRREKILHPLDGFGLVVPLVENRPLIAVSFASVKFSGRAPDGHVLFRVFIGGACQGALLEQSDDQLVETAVSQLEQLLGAQGEPVLTELARWQGAMPQYHVGHLDRVSAIESSLSGLANLELAGNAYHGVGIPACIHAGESAAERILKLDS
jgi:oxygen-dependent protoporphyrinogen oxidase